MNRRPQSVGFRHTYCPDTSHGVWTVLNSVNSCHDLLNYVISANPFRTFSRIWKVRMCTMVQPSFFWLRSPSFFGFPVLELRDPLDSVSGKNDNKKNRWCAMSTVRFPWWGNPPWQVSTFTLKRTEPAPPWSGGVRSSHKVL